MKLRSKHELKQELVIVHDQKLDEMWLLGYLSHISMLLSTIAKTSRILLNFRSQLYLRNLRGRRCALYLKIYEMTMETIGRFCK